MDLVFLPIYFHLFSQIVKKSTSFVVLCVVKDSLYRYRLKKE